MVFVLGIILVSILTALMFFERKHHKEKIDNLKIKVHVNGIRGKSSVTRLLAGVLRAGNYNTLAKVTGNSPNIIDQNGNDIPIIRKGPANVLEQVKIVKEHVTENTDALVLECMAVKPKFQKFLEEKVVNADVSIITNIREDHMDEMGYTLEEIAESLSSTLPTKGGYCITSEDNPKLREILEKKCKERNTIFCNALEYEVSDSYIKKFKHSEHKSNVKLGIALADILDIKKHVALKEMLLVKPEKEVLTVKKYKIGDKELIWVNMFSINDKDSFLLNWENVHSEYFDKNKNMANVCILNNRKDRSDRTKQFLKLVTKELHFDLNITFGAFEKQVVSHLKDYNKSFFTPGDLPINNPAKFIENIFEKTKTKSVLLYGLINIHTPQAQSLIKYLDNLKPLEN